MKRKNKDDDDGGKIGSEEGEEGTVSEPER